MEQLKNNRWVVLIVGVILIFICAGTVWASSDGHATAKQSEIAGMGACELTDVVFDEVFHPALSSRTAAWTQDDEKAADSSADKQLDSKQSAAKDQSVTEDKAKTSSKKTQTKDSSNVSDKQKSAQKQAQSAAVSAQKSAAATAAKAEAKAKAETAAKAAAKAEAKTAAKAEKAAKTEASSDAGAATVNTSPKKLFFTRTELLSQDQASEATWTYALSDEDLLLLERIVMAEAEGEPYAGKVAVANVVLNRLRSADYPNTIRDVIYQRYQFSPVQNGRFDRVVPSEDCVKAVKDALNGVKEVPDNTYYFVSISLATDMTIPNTRTPVKKIGHHTFFK
ncbi:cell wall hydrolase [Saccharibacillus sp. CPCC 101409]|uniref:cell wall hydrolase n=1 Tax=Saccharibacillus sp. CPCC 101409 TaxID=3058041 RepID=UPI0026729C5E|nr:cell wall hydrolase [Saccharibacillus sp. CPCC 101409]MDO3408575.1 cell wall hydrolase [Saccharibacillus sp. CPCC 101409]